ncbi:MAG: NTP transferase domain-containing protein [Paracoccaceae bacterium]
MVEKSKTSRSVVIILLAAGGSTRMMGADKLVRSIGAESLLRKAAREACASDARRILVVLRPGDSARREALAGLKLEIIENAHWTTGMSSSIQAGLNAAQHDATAAIIALADMPQITAADFNRLIRAHEAGTLGTICRATAEDGTPGHPVLFGSAHFERLRNLSGDQGARAILGAHSGLIVPVVLKGDRALSDLDTPRDWERYLGRRSGRSNRDDPGGTSKSLKEV